jgi:hypothetical protein
MSRRYLEERMQKLQNSNGNGGKEGKQDILSDLVRSHSMVS